MGPSEMRCDGLDDDGDGLFDGGSQCLRSCPVRMRSAMDTITTVMMPSTKGSKCCGECGPLSRSVMESIMIAMAS